jgi:hypothetical protein
MATSDSGQARGQDGRGDQGALSQVGEQGGSPLNHKPKIEYTKLSYRLKYTTDMMECPTCLIQRHNMPFIGRCGTGAQTSCRFCGDETFFVPLCMKCSDEHKICHGCDTPMSDGNHYVSEIDKTSTGDNYVRFRFILTHKLDGKLTEECLAWLSQIQSELKGKTADEIIEQCHAWKNNSEALKFSPQK